MDFNIRIKNTNPERSSNILSRLCFAWLIKILHRGNIDTLKLTDLYENLPTDKSDKLGNSLEKNWNEELTLAKQKSKTPSLLRAIRKSFFWSYMLCGLVLFVQYVIIRPLQPVVLAIFISSFSETAPGGLEDEEERMTQMYFSGGLIIIMSLLMLFVHHHVSLAIGQVGMRVRIACCSLLYRKMMRLSKKSLSQAAAGQIVNMMSNDVSRFDTVAAFLHHIWIMPIQAAVVTYFIWQQVQLAAIIGVGSLVLLTIPVNTYAGKLSAVLRLKIAQRTDTRIKKMAEIVAGIQVIKMYAWEKPFAKIVQQERINEIKILTLQSYLRGVTVGSAVFVERTVLFITVIAYVLLGNIITPDRVFSLAQFFNVLQLSMAIFYPNAAALGSETLISIKRLQEFLMLEEKPCSVLEKDASKSVRFENVSAAWTPDTKLLSNVDIDIQPGTLCAVIGPVGVGKSSLLQLLLGELTPSHGTLTVGGVISYASQEPWLFASSVQKNILFGRIYDEERYKEVVKVCALEKDFQLFPYGDKTEVGERGVSLSGGQKARINLARAVYSKADIYLLDDPLSAVDTRVGKHLFDKCIMGYLRGNTRILVTHQLQYLKKAQHIVVINDGKIEAQGTFEELSNGDLDFTKMLVAADECTETRIVANRRESRISICSVTSEKSENAENAIQAEDQEENMKYQGGSAYYEYFRAGGNVCVLLGLAMFFLLGQATSNGSDLWLTYWTNKEATYRDQCNNRGRIAFIPLSNAETTTGDINHDFYNISTDFLKADMDDPCDTLLPVNTSIYIYTAIIISSIILLTSRSIYFFKVTMNSSTNLHNKMFDRLLQAPMRFFDTNPSGRILNRFSRDMGMIDELLPRFMLEATQIFLVMIGILVMVIMTNVYMAVVAAIIGVIFYKFRGWYVTNARNIKHLEGIARSPVFSHLTATLNGITTIRASLAEHTLAKEFDLHQDTHTSVWYLMLATIASYGLWMDIFSVIFIGCAIISFIINYMYSEVNGSYVGLALSQALILTGMVQYGMKQTADVVSQMTSVERVLEYSKIEKEGGESNTCEVPPEDWPSSGVIKFVHVFLRYSQSEPFVLKNLNFHVKSGEKIGIVGRTGAGKSSLISALFRLAPLEGSIIIDNIDTKQLMLGDLRKKISIIPQDPVLFSATLRYNLDPFDEFSDTELWNALEAVELKDIATSLDFPVEENGTNLSVGQRQLVCLARAMLRNNKILILDEATANVDPQTDALIQRTIRNKFSQCTVLTVAHRLHTIMDSSKVLVMDAGAMVEYDHPHTLLQDSNGYLYKMVEQTGPSMTKQLHDVAKDTFMKTIAEVDENETSHL